MNYILVDNFSLNYTYSNIAEGICYCLYRFSDNEP